MAKIYRLCVKEARVTLNEDGRSKTWRDALPGLVLEWGKEFEDVNLSDGFAEVLPHYGEPLVEEIELPKGLVNDEEELEILVRWLNLHAVSCHEDWA